MIQLKKPLLLLMGLVVLVSPLIPSVRATNGQWGSSIAEASWNYDLYRVERLNFKLNAKGPFEVQDAVYVTEPAGAQVTMTLLKDGKSLALSNVSSQVETAFWQMNQKERFVFDVISADKASWSTVFEYLPQTGILNTLATIERKPTDLKYVTSVAEGTRIYSELLHADKETGAIETKLAVSDAATKYKRDDITFTVKPPLQQILDVQDNMILSKFTFDGGFQQLMLIDDTARTIKDIPGTWVDAQGSLVAGRFLSDGTVQYFQNYRLFTYTPGAEKPTESGGAYLSWYLPTEQAVQMNGSRMAYVDPQNTLYVTTPTGSSAFGTALNGQFTLEKEAIYFQTVSGAKSYTFSTKTWKNEPFFVTDTYQDILVGTDAQGNIWYKNATSGKSVSVGYGTNPVLTDRQHVVWKGTDGELYQATLATALELGGADVQAYKTSDLPTVYLKSGNKMWRVMDETTFFTWFDSWKDVVTVSTPTLNMYLNQSVYAGDATFAPGTRVKAVGNPRVYVVGNDGAIHWIVSEAVADSIYGPKWNKNILEVAVPELWNYAKGTDVTSTQDIKQI